jgi:hypothetical protein
LEKQMQQVKMQQPQYRGYPMIQASDLVGLALDYAVAACEGYTLTTDGISNLVEIDGNLFILGRATSAGKPCGYSPQNYWNQGGPIIDREGISIIRAEDDYGADKEGFCNSVRIPVWAAAEGQHSVETSTEHQSHDAMFQMYESEVHYGPTPLIAAMRCYVTRKLGKVLKIPPQFSSLRK